MDKLLLSQLEEARRDPGAFRSRMYNPSGLRKWGYINVLREAIRQFHKMGDSAQAGHSYLEENLGKFRNELRSIDTVHQFAWYINDYHNRGWYVTETYHNVIVPMEDLGFPIRCSGEISRIDIIPQKGYAAWMFRRKDPNGWKRELRMPIIQDVTAGLLGVPSSEIVVGIISFKERFTDFHSYSEEQITAAYVELSDLINTIFPG